MTKNDCERNASKRWISKFRQHHPKMPVIIIEDSLASNVPHLLALKQYDCRYLTSFKESDHKYLYQQFKINSQNNLTTHYQENFLTGGKVLKKVTHTYEFIKDLELNGQHDFKINAILFNEKIEYNNPAQNKKNIPDVNRTFSWITDLDINEANIAEVVLLARRRWAIENETFQTLKKETNYNLEHNYDHGSDYLAVNLAILCILAFLTDQVQEFVCKLFKEVLSIAGAKYAMWNKWKSGLEWIDMISFEDFYQLIISRNNTT